MFPWVRARHVRRLLGGVAIALVLYLLLWSVSPLAMPHTVLIGRLHPPAAVSGVTPRSAPISSPNARLRISGEADGESLVLLSSFGASLLFRSYFK